MVEKIEDAEDGSMFIGGVRLSKEEVDRIRKAAEHKAKQTLEKEATARLTREMDQQALDDLRKKSSISKHNEPLVDVVIDLPEFTDRITLDGREFYHSSIVKVTEDVARTLNELMSTAWRHQNQVDGIRPNPYQRHRNPTIGRGGIRGNSPMTV